MLVFCTCTNKILAAIDEFLSSKYQLFVRIGVSSELSFERMFGSEWMNKTKLEREQYAVAVILLPACIFWNRHSITLTPINMFVWNTIEGNATTVVNDFIFITVGGISCFRNKSRFWPTWEMSSILIVELGSYRHFTVYIKMSFVVMIHLQIRQIFLVCVYFHAFVHQQEWLNCKLFCTVRWFCWFFQLVFGVVILTYICNFKQLCKSDWCKELILFFALLQLNQFILVLWFIIWLINTITSWEIDKNLRVGILSTCRT